MITLVKAFVGRDSYHKAFFKYVIVAMAILSYLNADLILETFNSIRVGLYIEQYGYYKSITATAAYQPLVFNYEFLQELAKIGFKDSKEKIIDFFYGSIEKREFSKFLFTKYLSELLKLISKKLNKYKINNNEISMLTIRNIQDFFKKKKNINDLKNIIKKNTKNYEANNKCDMPNLITSINDFKVFNLFLDEPNFIGNKPINQNTVFINHQEKVKKLDNI